MILQTAHEKRVAITGFSFRLPQTNQAQFWKDLIDGRDLISQVAPERWSQDVFLHPSRKPPGTAVTFAAGSLGDVSGFDAEFFGISPREAAQMEIGRASCRERGEVAE